MTHVKETLILTFSLLLAGGVAVSADDGRKKAPAADPAPVVFICEHGSVKSLIAREWFNRLARERGLSVRAISRGITPDAAVPEAIATALRGDGFDVQGFAPQRVDAPALTGATRIVAIGVERSALPVSPSAAVETWEGIPPATQQYEAARDAMKARIEVLLKNLESATRP